jgi:diguanylate cyclase (GGDEF)-like protein/PAS domain S-box-containing protein
MIIAAGSGVMGLWIAASATLREDFRHYLAGIANVAAQQVDPVLHQALRDPAQRNGEDYLRAVAPLRRMQASLSDVRYIYTMVHEAGQFHFVLDAAAPGDRDGDGIDDQAQLWEVYAERDSAMPVVFGLDGKPGRAASTDRPFSDKWGSFMTGWAPLVDAHGVQYGAVGVDIDAGVFLAHMHHTRQWALLGLLPAALLIAALCIGYHRVRLRSLMAARTASRASQVLTQEQQRLRTVLEASSVGTWESSVGEPGAEYTVVDEHWAAMLGMRAEELNPIPFSKFYAHYVHPDDLAAIHAAITRSRTGEDGMVDVDVRMRHADGYWLWTEVRGRITERDANGLPLRVVGTQMDVSMRKRMEHALLQSQGNFRSLFELSPVGICLADLATGRFLQANDALLASTGYTREELLQLTFWDITPQRWHASERQQITVLEHSNHFGTYEKEYQRKNGSRYPVLISGTRMKDDAGRDVVWAIVQDISERKAMESELADAARRDKLTGLANRTLFMERLQQAVERVRSGEQQHFAVLFLDFDRFKLVNDALGHEVGDGLLRQIAQRLTSSLRQSQQGRDSDAALVARFGGDEFLVLINRLEDACAAQRIADRLLVSLSQTYTVAGRDVYSTASIGIVTSGLCLESAEAVIRNADVAMYEAKHSGRACAVMFDEAMRDRLTRFVTIDGCLRKALGTSELSLVFQPIVELDTLQVNSVEALLRWRHPQLGEVSPSEFIPVAEESGFIATLGQWVLQEACQALAAWRAQDPQRAPRSISVNVSRAELALGERLLARVRDTLLRTGLPPACLRLEVTERDVMRDPAATLQLMLALREMGVELAMDDFGTGSSSLGCLRDYPFDVIKIDRSFVSDLAANPDVLAMIHAAITLVRNLGKTSVAEGVENSQQVAILQSLGCQHGQGYHFSRPMTWEQICRATQQRNLLARSA